MKHMMDLLAEARAGLEQKIHEVPSAAIVLGSGYRRLADALESSAEVVLPYQQIPHFPLCTNPNHPGRLVVGTLAGFRVVLLSGRVHCYEGYSAAEVTFAVRALARWGVRTFILTNAAGGIHPDYRIGDFVAICDHLNFIGQNPLVGLRGINVDDRHPDLSRLYDVSLIAAAKRAHLASVRLHSGVYAAMLGPSYETPAEIRMLQRLGADVVGMSTVPEAIALAQERCRVFGLSCVSNLAAGLSTQPILDHDVTNALAEPSVQQALEQIIGEVLHAI